MQKLTDLNGKTFGPFSSIEVLEDRYHCDGTDLPFSVVGECAVGAWDNTPAEFSTRQLSLVDQISKERDSRLYTNVEATFPPGVKVIQFRNQTDQLALSNVVQGAMVNCMLGNPTAATIFITEDNAVQELQASQMVAIGMAALQAKQGIVHAARTKKNYVLGLVCSVENLSTLQSYDVGADW